VNSKQIVYDIHYNLHIPRTPFEKGGNSSTGSE